MDRKTYDWLDSRINERGAIAACIARNAEGGKVLLVESGRDCDGVEYSGRTRLIDATLSAYLTTRDEISEWADGPFRLDFARPSEDADIEYDSLDLVMEAHEDGHPHVIYSQFP